MVTFAGLASRNHHRRINSNRIRDLGGESRDEGLGSPHGGVAWSGSKAAGDRLTMTPAGLESGGPTVTTRVLLVPWR